MRTGVVASPYLITTRLDNDDALSNDHMASVQRAFQDQSREFISFPFGLQSLRGHLYNVYWTANPFLSLIERVGNDGRFTTVFCVAHDRVRDQGKVRGIVDAPQWLQVLHGSNLHNALRGWPRLNSRTHSRFSVIWPKEEIRDSGDADSDAR